MVRTWYTTWSKLHYKVLGDLELGDLEIHFGILLVVVYVDMGVTIVLTPDRSLHQTLSSFGTGAKSVFGSPSASRVDLR